MDKQFAKKIVSVLLGIALITIVYSLFSLIFESWFIDDVIVLNGKPDDLSEIMSLIKWQTVSLVCVIVPTLVCYVFAYFGNEKIFNIFSAALSLLVFAMCIAFIIVTRNKTFATNSATTYSAITEALGEFITLAASAALFCAYFVINSVFSFIHKQKSSITEETTEVNDSEKV